jgi:hypothetical protein
MSNFAIHIKNRSHYYKCRNYLLELKLIRKNRYFGRIEDIIGCYLVVKDDFVSLRMNRSLLDKQNIPVIIYPVGSDAPNRKPRKRIKEDSLPLLSELNLTYKELFEGLGYKISNQLYRIKNKDAVLTTLEKVLDLQKKRLLEK